MIVESASTWRSYKSFYHNGNVRKHSLTYYREIILEANDRLTLTTFSAFTTTKTLEKSDWKVQAWDNRRFLFLEGKKAFEIITFDKNDVVLVDAVTAEKTFYVTLGDWQSMLEPSKKPDDNIHLTLWSPTLINRINIKK